MLVFKIATSYSDLFGRFRCDTEQVFVVIIIIVICEQMAPACFRSQLGFGFTGNKESLVCVPKLLQQLAASISSHGYW